MSNELVKYNYDVVTISPKDIAVYGYVQPNDSIVISIQDEMKNDIEQMRNRDDIIRNVIINPELGLCLGFNFEGKLFRGGRVYWDTRVFYYNPTKAYLQSLLKK